MHLIQCGWSRVHTRYVCPTVPVLSSSSLPSSVCLLFYIFYKFIVVRRCCWPSLGRSAMTRRPNRDKCGSILCECKLTFVHRSWHSSILSFFRFVCVLHSVRLHSFEFPRIKKFIFKNQDDDKIKYCSNRTTTTNGKNQFKCLERSAMSVCTRYFTESERANASPLNAEREKN